MNGAVALLPLVLVPLVVALVATRIVGDRVYFVVGCAIAAELVTIPLTRWWSQYAAARALARAHAEHRDFLIVRAPQTLGHQIVVCIVLAMIAAAIAAIVFPLARPAQTGGA